MAERSQTADDVWVSELVHGFQSSSFFPPILSYIFVVLEIAHLLQSNKL